MDKISPLLLLGLLSMVGAMDIIFYSSTGACSGSGYSVNGAPARTWYIVNGGSVLFRDMDGCKTSSVYKNGVCNSNFVGSGTGNLCYVGGGKNGGCNSNSVGSSTGNLCYVGGGFTSGYWYQSCRRRSLLESDSTKCEEEGKPTGVVFISSKGSWVLKSSDAAELFSQLESLPEGEKATG